MISGAPGSGKSTLAAELAPELDFALLSKDVIKETLFDQLGRGALELAANRRIGGAAMEVLWKLTGFCPRVVIEANFRPKSAYERNKIKALEGELIEVFCRCPPDEAKRRFAERARSGDHHPSHIFRTLPPKSLAEYETPVGIGRVIEVDTSRPVDVPDLARRIERMWGGGD